MFEKYFNIRYVFGKDNVWDAINKVISERQKGYVVVADGVVVDNVQMVPEYRQTVEGSLFAICDSGWVPVYLKRIYGIEREQYCGAEILKDAILQRRYRQFFMGTQQRTLDGMKENLSQWNPDVARMSFCELPFCSIEEFDYHAIAKMIEEDGADIIWVALGAPKQDYFMQRLLPYLKHGVMLGVGAAFKFYSGTEEKRAPEWMLNSHLEFVYRIMQDPKKQLKRCWGILKSLRKMIGGEKDKKKEMDVLINVMQEYISELKKQIEVKGKSSKALGKVTKKVVAAIYKHDKKELCQWVNCKIVAVVMSVLNALDVTIRLNKTDGHMKTVLKSYARDLVDLLDGNDADSKEVLEKARELGIVANHP